MSFQPESDFFTWKMRSCDRETNAQFHIAPKARLNLQSKATLSKDANSEVETEQMLKLNQRLNMNEKLKLNQKKSLKVFKKKKTFLLLHWNMKTLR